MYPGPLYHSRLPLLSPRIKATVRITRVQAVVGSYCQCSLYVCTCVHMEARGQPWVWFLRCSPSSLEARSLAGLELAAGLGLLTYSYPWLFLWVLGT